MPSGQGAVHEMRLRIVLLALAVALCLTGLVAILEAVALGERPAFVDVALDFAETQMLVAAIFASVLILPRVRALESEAALLRRDIGIAAAAGAEWRARSRRTLVSLSQSIEEQFHVWDLTPAECDVAGLILKGMSLKDIAIARATSQATIRQQAQSVYRKSGLNGRAELAAYFLEDLFNARDRDMAGTIEVPTGTPRQ